MSEEAKLPPATGADEDPSIPLLTDRIFLPAVELDTALPASLAAPPPAASEQPEPTAAEPEPPVQDAATTAPEGEQLAPCIAAPPVEAAAAGGPQDHDAEAAIEAEAEALRAAVLQRLAVRLPEQVSTAVRELMQPAIEQAMAKLGEEAEVALRITLQDLVEQALREEIARHRGGDTPH